ncbi:MAG: O-methyltransferase [Peptostreptococcus sp.]|uniref:O-methyltransferase n=1 Tax=Peptostreptococcus TaxID=1257 RepID=UPI00290F2F95|nr:MULTISPECIES: O-methyltransferase [Peptostreptococcus]MDU3422658.1 O-methyltransferase [Peptostreptococcus anaerobius]MDU3429542.1 O-methyltransferase [Peptostreptococcus sp.]MDU3455639.1 O-methyltransferase [Peptostreptococcus sp.]MDU5682072.1 O-methyltransferase [Peptostreptococcus sp.]MDU5737808.1 O-methyltransferase [Peptostreptococcus sp.]
MSNIVNDLVEDYIRNILKENKSLILEMEEYAKENSVPIIHKEVAELLRFILDIHKPKRILEIGCAIGYSSIFFATVLGGDVEIITTERNPVMLEKAYENIEKAGLKDKIKILVGDAAQTLKDLYGEFDMIFIDAAKGQYKMFYDMVTPQLKKGGIVISDNILYKGMIASDDFVVRRKRTIVKRMREYLDYICSLEDVDTSILPVGDGVALSYKK